MSLQPQKEQRIQAVLERARQIDPEVSAAIFLRRDRELAWKICQKHVSVHETQAELYLDPDKAYTNPELVDQLAREYIELRKQEK
jgi:hypothetical protein